MNAREKAWTYYRDVVLEKSGEMICGEIFLKDGGELVCAREVLVCGEFCSAKMWFVDNTMVFLILRSYDEDEDNEEESEKSSSSSTTSGLSGLGACSTPPS